MGVQKAVVDTFQNLRLSKNIKYNELANISGVTPSTVYGMMSEKRKILKLKPSVLFRVKA